MTSLDGATALEPAELNRLAQSWAKPRGLIGWLSAADHQTLRIRYLVTGFGFFAFAGLLALGMRLQLSQPQNTVLGPALYNEFFSTHGTVMMFLFAVPITRVLGLSGAA